MKIGSLDLGETPLFLAPMEDVTYKSFRYMCKKYGADVMYTEFIPSEALIRGIKQIRQKMSIFEFDRPVAIQIYGHNIDSMVYAAKVAEEAQPDFIDINYGCPVKKIVKRGAGAGMLQDLDKMQKMTEEVVKAVSIPVTAKTRLGWDSKTIVIREAARRLQDAGISALAIHGRTREQIYSGEADWNLIGEVKNDPYIKIPIIGNGDIKSPVVAAERLKQTGVDALMIGRESIGRPWIFKEIKHYFATGECLPPPTVIQVIENMKKQLEMCIEWKDNSHTAIRMMRRHFAKYFPGIPNFKNYRIRLLQEDDLDKLNEIMNEIVDIFGDIRVNYAEQSLK